MSLVLSAGFLQPVIAEDMQQYLSDTQALVREKKCQEALDSPRLREALPQKALEEKQPAK